MIGDTSKQTTREKKKIGAVLNRPIEVLPYEKGDNKDLTLTFKAKNFNDRELTVKPDEYIDNVPFGYLPNIIKETGDGNLILDFADKGYNHIILDKDIYINNILNIENGAEYTLVFEQDSVGGHSVMIDTDNINLYLANELSLDDINKNPNDITIINLTCVFGELYGEINSFNTSEYTNVVSTSFDFDINVTTASLDFTLPIQDGEDNYKHDFVVDWGDNTTSEVKSFDSSGATHTYAVEGNYTVKIIGICEYFAFNNGGDKLKLIKLNSFNGDCGFKVLNFWGCTNLAGEIPKSFTNLHKLETAERLFYNCSNLTGEIPEDMFWNSKDIISCLFSFASSINDKPIKLTGSIPEKLFANNPLVTDFSYTFYQCSNLTGSILEKLFANNPLVTSFQQTFQQCTGLTGSIPEKLFANNPLVTSFQQTFQQCTGLTGELPKNLFINNKEVSNFMYTFWGSNKLTGRGWEDIITNAEQNAIDGGFSLSKTQCFRNCNALTDYLQIPTTWR